MRLGEVLSENSTPFIVSVVPTFNEEKYIERCIISLLNQTYPQDSHLIHILDGGSTDNTVKIVKSVIERHKGNPYPKIILLENHNKFVPHARNLSLEDMPKSTDFVFEMIAHGYVPEDHLKSRVQDLLEIETEIGRKVGGVGTKVLNDENTTSLVGRWVEVTLTSLLGNSGGQFSQFKGRHPHKIPAFVLHRYTALIDVDGWDERFVTNQDSDISMRLMKNGWPIWRSDTSHVRMTKRQSIPDFIQMCWRYGTWRRVNITTHKTRISLRELLQTFGLFCILISLIFIPNLFFIPIVMYCIVLLIESTRCVIIHRDITLIFGLPICLILLHTFFTLGLIIGRPNSSSD